MSKKLKFSSQRGEVISSCYFASLAPNGTGASVQTRFESGVLPSCFGLVARPDFTQNEAFLSIDPTALTEVKNDSGKYVKVNARDHFVEETMSFVNESIRIFLEACVMYGLDTPFTRRTNEYYWSYITSIDALTERILRCQTVDVMIKWWKYKIVAFFNHYEKQPLPERPPCVDIEDHPGYILGGIPGQYLRKTARQSPEFLLTIQMLKKGMPRATRDLIKKAEKAMVRELTTKRPQRPAYNYHSSELTEEVEHALKYILSKDGNSVWFQHGWRQHKPMLSVEMCSELVTELVADGWAEDNSLKIFRERELPQLITVEQAKYQLRRSVREIFNNKSFGIADLSEPCFPSFSANYNNTREKLGAVGHLKINYGSRECEPSAEPTDSFFDGGQVPFSGLSYCLDASDIEEKYRSFYWQMFSDAMNEQPLVKPVGLAEALKIRVISKGPPLTYTCLKPFQKFLWRSLKDLPVFRLIGRPATVDDIEEICGFDLRSYYNSGDYASSTDRLYSWVSETILDELSDVLRLPPQLTELSYRALTGHVFLTDDAELAKEMDARAATFREVADARAYMGGGFGRGHEMMRPLDSDWDWDYLKVMTSATDEQLSRWALYREGEAELPFIHHPLRHMKEDDPWCWNGMPNMSRRYWVIPQQTGQLMGSIISFPFLCIANFALCRWALEIAERRNVKLKGAPMLINGDDNLIRTLSARYHDIWLKCCAIAGLDSSVGKTYFNQKFAVINSMHFDFLDGRWIERKYINMGLFTCKKRSAGVADDDKELLPIIGSIYNDLMRMCPEDMRERVHHRWLYLNAERLRKYRGSWWLPHYCGGLGLKNESMLTQLDYDLAHGVRRWINLGNQSGGWPLKKESDILNLSRNFIRKSCPLYSEVEATAVHLRCGEVLDLEHQSARVGNLIAVAAFLSFDLSEIAKVVKNKDDGIKRNLNVLKQGLSMKVRTKPDFGQLYGSLPDEYMNVFLKEKI